MIITAAHRELWLLKKAPAFIRASMPQNMNKKPIFAHDFNINDCIPVNVPQPSFEKRCRAYKSNVFPLKRTKYHLANTMSVLRLMRANGEDLVEGLSRLSQDRQSITRQVFALKWLKRIKENREKRFIDYQI